MARRLRNDRPGALYHVMNRGVARRTIFDTPGDYRFFLACLACAVRRGEIDVLAYALLRTHFHLLLRSHGGLSDALRRIQLRHVRRFNRLHRRDGPLLRGRFMSKRVSDAPYARNVVHYTHENPVLAGLCEAPQDYPWCSAWLAGQARLPGRAASKDLQSEPRVTPRRAPRRPDGRACPPCGRAEHALRSARVYFSAARDAPILRCGGRDSLLRSTACRAGGPLLALPARRGCRSADPWISTSPVQSRAAQNSRMRARTDFTWASPSVTEARSSSRITRSSSPSPARPAIATRSGRKISRLR